MNFKIINYLTVFLDNYISEKNLSKLQEFLMSGAIFTEASKVLAILIIFILTCEIALALMILMFSLPISLLFLPFFVIPGLFTYIIVQQERRAQEIEKTAPDFLRQLSSMLQVGLSFENAMEDMSQYGNGPLYFQSTGTVSNCNFINNKATGTDSWGGAVHFYDEGSVSNCNFVDNKTAAGVLGGGRLTLAQGAGKNADKMDEAIQTAVDLIKG